MAKRTPSFIRQSEADWFRKTKKTYNQRIDREVRRRQKTDKGATYESLLKEGLVKAKITGGVRDFKTRKAFLKKTMELHEQTRMQASAPVSRRKQRKPYTYERPQPSIATDSERPKQAPLFKKKKYSRRPSYISESEAAEYRRAKKTYNQRIDREVKKWQRIDEKATYESLVRQGLVLPKIQSGVGDFRNNEAFRRSLEAMKEPLTETWKAERLNRMQKRMSEIMKMAYAPEEKTGELIDKIVGQMSDKDIFSFTIENPDIVKDYYEKYKEHGKDGVVDGEQFRDDLYKLMEALQPFAEKFGLEDEYNEALDEIGLSEINKSLVS